MVNQDQTELERLAKAYELRRERDDINLQLAGYDTGRVRRSFNEGGFTAEALAEKKRKDEQDHRLIRKAFGMSFEDRLEDLNDRLVVAQAASYEALIDAQDARDFAFDALKALRANAHVHPDGRRVYLSEDGTYAIDENFNRLTANDRAKVEWRPGKTTLEEYVDGRDALEKTSLKLKEAASFHSKVTDAQQKAENGEITTESDLNEINDMLNSAPRTVRIRMNDPETGYQIDTGSHSSNHAISQGQQLRPN